MGDSPRVTESDTAEHAYTHIWFASFSYTEEWLNIFTDSTPWKAVKR